MFASEGEEQGTWGEACFYIFCIFWILYHVHATQMKKIQARKEFVQGHTGSNG